MATSERREEIARTLFLSDYDEFTPDKVDASSTWLTLRESYLTNADALLAAFPVLAGVTDEMAEAGARADAWEDGYRVGWHDRDDDAKAGWIPSRFEQDTPNPYRKETP